MLSPEDVKVPTVDEFHAGYTHSMLLCKTSVPAHGGYASRYRFRNGLGASVVHHAHSYDRELAVIKFFPIEDGNPWDFEITYDTPITTDVVGYISDDFVLEGLLNRIAELPPEARWLEGAVLDEGA